MRIEIIAPVIRRMTEYYWLGVGDDVRTLWGRFAGLAKTIWRYSKTEEGQHMMNNIRTLVESETGAAKEEASRSRCAKVVKAAYRARGGDASSLRPLLQ
jgi:hypothetical protein